MKKIPQLSLALFLSVALLPGCKGKGNTTATPAASSDTVQRAAGLQPPQGVKATGGINKVTLSWDPVPGADSYMIYWSRNPRVTKANGIKITKAQSPYQHVGLFISTTYYYVVTAVKGSEESAASSQAATVAAHDGANLYQKHCAKCHGPVQTTSIKNGLPDLIKKAIANNTGGMGALAGLPADKINIISQQLPCH
jgi:cytochrome c553